MATAQLNFRMDARLKEDGNLTLGEYGISPTEIVRNTWSYLVRNRHSPNAIRRLVDLLRESDVEDEASRESGNTAQLDGNDYADELVMKAPLLIQQFYREAGIDPSRIEQPPFSEMKTRAYAEKYGRYGEIA